MYIGEADKLFDASGEFVNPSRRDFCSKFLATSDAWIRKQRSPARP